MKNIILKFGSLFLLLAIVVACNDDDNFTYDAPPQADVTTVDISAVNSASSICGADVTVTVSDKCDVYYLLVQSGADAPVSEDVWQFGSNLTFEEAGVQSFLILGFVQDTDYKIYSVTVNKDGLRSEQVYTSNYSHPDYDGSTLPSTLFLGDYTIEDNVATIGPANGTENFAAGTVTLTADPLDATKRLFDAAVLPAFNSEIEQITLEFDSSNAVVLGFVDPSLSCNGFTPYIFADAANFNSIWNVCDDQSITVNYTEDPNGSCGGPFPASFTLTKVN